MKKYESAIASVDATARKSDVFSTSVIKISF